MPFQKTVCIVTLGCRVNQYESDALGEKLEKMGFVLVSPGEKADITIVNTCTVTGESDRKSRQMIRRAAGEGSAVVVTGCFAQVSAEAAAAIPGVAYVCGNGEKSRIADVVLALAQGQDVEQMGVTDIMDAGYDPMRRHTPRRFRSFIKIEDGCENRCAYCIIPAARGKVRSRGKGEILAEAEALAAAGSPEVILTGIETASYGVDGERRGRYGMALAELLAEVDMVPGIRRVSMGSLEPTVMSEAFVEALAGMKHLLPHFHLSIQSGSSSVLRRMRRRYTAQMALEAIARVRRAVPEATFSADVIVGFPGETEAEAAETMAFVREARFLHLHLFPYSRRAGTEAADMPDQVQENEKKARLKALEELQSGIRREMLENYVNTHREKPVFVLVEQQKGRIANGHSEHFVEINIETDADLNGQIVPVLLCGTDGKICTGYVGCGEA
ncbi:MAG: tRNA (N(6)-L-threonylcarbamoyladenosine(37)-C(2))-methylthiotransferase MtaB [Clostridia bacterium]|nr:tRNA (N(6)-L-threonylcarbamoyladenosine(37)-C(2))-methylthiotransferase MtaB [Clostridia bacterium]